MASVKGSIGGRFDDLGAVVGFLPSLLRRILEMALDKERSGTKSFRHIQRFCRKSVLKKSFGIFNDFGAFVKLQPFRRLRLPDPAKSRDLPKWL